MSGKFGSDPAELARTADRMRDSATSLESIAKALTAQLGSAPWRGRSADRFRADWSRVHRGQLVAAAARLRDAEQSLRHNSTQQLEASAADGGRATATGGFDWSTGWLEAFGGTAAGSGSTQLAGFLGLATPAMLAALSTADFVGGIPDYLRAGRVLSHDSAIRASLGLSGVPAANWIKVVGGKVPIAESALAIAEFAFNWNQHGLYHENTYEAAVMGGLGVGAGMVAGPLGGLAFSAGNTVGQLICDYTPVDETLSDASWAMAYGDKQLQISDPPPGFYSNADSSEIAEYSRRANEASAEASRVAERACKPWLFATDIVRGTISQARFW